MIGFRTFGAIDLRREDGERLELLRQPKRLAVLAYLAAEQTSGPVRREQLLPLLWSGSAPSSARHALSSTLSRLRGTLGSDVVRGRGEETLWLDPDQFEADVLTFREALAGGRPHEAVEVYRGRFLEGFRIADARPFEEWLRERRDRFHREAYRAGLDAGEAAREAGDLGSAESALRRAVEIRPHGEEAVARLLSVLAERGERGEALRLYGEFRDRLDDELGLSPSERLESIADRIRSESRTVDGTAAGAVKDGAGDVTPPDRGPEAASGPDEDVGESPDHGARAGPRQPAFAASLLAALLLVAAGLWAWQELASPDGPGERAVGSEEPAESTTLAVLPFEQLDGGGQSRLFARGLRGELVTRLSGIAGLDVVAGSSVDRHVADGLALPALADSLGARWMLTGDVQQAGDTIRVFARLVDSETETNEWATTFRRDRSSEHLFAIQGELTRRIVESLQRVQPSPTDRKRLSSPPTESATAYELYLQARGLTYPVTPSEQSANRAVRLYRRALRVDSTFAPAWSGLADVYAERVWRFGYARAWADSGADAARTATRLDPRRPDAYAQLGDNLGTLDSTDRQIEAYRTALDLRPGYRPVLANLAAVHAGSGRLAEAMRWLDRVSVPSSRPPGMLRRLALENARLGRTDVVDGWMEYARELGYELPWITFNVHLVYRENTDRARQTLRRIAGDAQAPPSLQRAALAMYDHDWKAAIRSYERVLSSSRAGRPPPFLAARPGMAYAFDRLGREEEARELARAAIDSAATLPRLWGPPSGTIQRGVARLVLGDTARALGRLEEAVDEGFLDVRGARTAPTLDPLRDHPRFQGLIGRMDSLLTVERRRVDEAGWGEPPDRDSPGAGGP